MDDDPVRTAPQGAMQQVSSTPLSVQMLHAILDGETFGDAARRFGVKRTTLERRVKTLVLQLMQTVGVDGLNDMSASQVRRLRAHREAILAALAQFDLPDLEMAPARVLSVAEVELGARRIREHAARPVHDLALYRLLFATGMRPAEAARLVVADYLAAGGEVRTVSLLRPQAAVHGRPRPLHFGSRALATAMGDYLEQRRQAGQGIGPDGRWRGLDPDSALLMDATGASYIDPPELTGGAGLPGSRALLEICRKLFRQTGIVGMGVQSARLTLAARMYAHGADEVQVGEVLGITERRAVRQLLPKPRPSLVELMDSIG